MKYLLSLFISAGMIFSFSACTTSTTENDAEDSDTTAMETEVQEVPEMPMAMAAISSASGSSVSGNVSFTQTGDHTVQMEIEIMHLTPGAHAIHLHQNGDCSAADATSAGGHWNPAGVDHGNRMQDDVYHAGDITNIEAGSDSTVTRSIEITGWTIGGADSTNIVNHAVIIHAGADDFTSQPSGAAGSRVACGVIQMQ